jgi:hypothetical protein
MGGRGHGNRKRKVKEEERECERRERKRRLLTTNISSYSLSILNLIVRLPWLNSEHVRSYTKREG